MEPKSTCCNAPVLSRDGNITVCENCGLDCGTVTIDDLGDEAALQTIEQ